MPLGPEEAAAVVAARGDDVETIASKLKVIVKGAGDDNFLIVSGGVYYVQFIASKGYDGLSLEAVSNANLEREDRIDSASAAKLLDFGFDAPDGDVPNFALDFVPKNDNDYAYLAALAVAVLTDVFQIPADTAFEYEASTD